MSGSAGWRPGLVETRCRLRYYWLGEIAASPLNGVPIQALLALSWSAPRDGLLNLTFFLAATFASALPVRLRVWAYCRVALALRYLPSTDRRIDHRIWTFGARLCGLEASSCA